MTTRRFGTHNVEACGSILEALRLLAGATRLEILSELTLGAFDVGTLAARLELDVPTISVHLGRLRRSGLVTAERIKKRRIYRFGHCVQATPNGRMHQMRVHCETGESVSLELNPISAPNGLRHEVQVP